MCTFFFCSTPLPPLPIDKRLLMENGSNRSSGSSSNYVHLVDHHTADYDNIYTKPTVLKLISMLVPTREALSMHDVSFRFYKDKEEVCMMKNE